MTKQVRRRFWPESACAVVAALLAAITLIKRDWIEAVFGVNPDGGNGGLEWLIVAALLVATVALGSLATYEWRRAARVA
ncbi:MAG TPA: hypothetical protein VJN88_06780 [Ktedonobacterales bacterium]|nr:hypothetical protein [Ktedonobacterales bacterium]